MPTDAAIKSAIGVVQELLRAGINVYTTMNVQHLESLNNKVAAITQVPVHERVPDRVFDRAASVELIDIEPEELIERLNAGKIYKTDQARRALSHFFTKKNLAALREIALRRTADRLNRNSYASGLGAGEDVLLYVSERPGDVRAIRAAANMAQTYHGNLVALVVESSAGGRALGAEEERALRSNVALAGAWRACRHRPGRRSRRPDRAIRPCGGEIGRVVLGSSGNEGRYFGFGETMAKRLMRLASGLCVSVVPDASAAHRVTAVQSPILRFSLRDAWIALAATVVSCLVGFGAFQTEFGSSVVPMLFLLFYCDFRALRRHGDV